MRQYKTRVRRMRPARSDREREDEPRQTYYDTGIRAAKAAQARQDERDEQDEQG